MDQDLTSLEVLNEAIIIHFFQKRERRISSNVFIHKYYPGYISFKLYIRFSYSIKVKIKVRHHDNTKIPFVHSSFLL